MSKVQTKVPIKVHNRSGFNLDHENLLTIKCGTLTPTLCDFLLPNDKISLGASLQAQLPPMASDFYGNVEVKNEVFFVPCRLLWGGWQDFITQPTNHSIAPQPSVPSFGGSAIYKRPTAIPTMFVSSGNTGSIPGVSAYGAGSLADYLGCKIITTPTGISYELNSLPFVAYHRIYDDWYRDSRLQQPLFIRPTAYANGSSSRPVACFLPYLSLSSESNTNFIDYTLGDGSKLTDLHQRNWARDYFTNATPAPQNGQGSTISFTTSSNKGSISIQQIRAANSLQKWLERNNIAGNRYFDQILAHYGCVPSDASLQRALYLGSFSVNCYNKSVYETAQNPSSGSNPFIGQIGAKASFTQAVGDGSLVGEFTAKEHGYLMVITSLVPRALYSSGIKKHFNYSKIGDIPFPDLANVGDQEIVATEICDNVVSALNSPIFGYTQRYSECKFMNDEVHGLLRDGESLDSFALQRSFSEAPQIGSDFIKIPQNYMDQVTAVDAAVSNFGAWCDFFFKYSKVSTLPAYSIPSLEGDEDTHTIVVDNGGRRL